MIHIGHIDINVVLHCVNRCVGCSHASPYSTPWFMPLETIRDDLECLKKVARPQTINIVGGEPLLHQEIVGILNTIHSIGASTDTCLITNGKLLSQMPETFWSSLKQLVVSQYPDLDRAYLDLAESKALHYGFGYGVREFHEFFAQFESNDGSNFHDCPWRKDCYTVHCGKLYLCPQSAFFPSRFMGLAESPDGISIHGASEGEIADFIARTTPLSTCTICGAYKRKIPWRQAHSEEDWKEGSKV